MHHIVVKRLVVLLAIVFVLAILLFAIFEGPVSTGSF